MPDIRDSLERDAETQRLSAVAAVTHPSADVSPPVLPALEDLPVELMRFAVPHADIDMLCALLPRFAQVPEQELLRTCVATIVDGMGSVDGMLALPRLRTTDDPLSRYFYVFVYLAARSAVEGFHRDHGVPAAITDVTLTDVGRNMEVHRWRHPGLGGFEDYDWLSIHFVGALYALGRMQFQRARLGHRTSATITAAGLDAQHGEPVLSLHIPRFYGPMTMSLVESAVEKARAFFPEHFPNEQYRYAVCKSWLLDPQFAEYLPARSNILAFQRWMHYAYSDSEPDDAGVLQFVFADSERPRGQLPRETSMQRGLLDHLDSGRHWHAAMAWVAL